jgi:hypothetical protein
MSDEKLKQKKCMVKIRNDAMSFACGKELHVRFLEEISKMKYCPFCGKRIG